MEVVYALPTPVRGAFYALPVRQVTNRAWNRRRTKRSTSIVVLKTEPKKSAGANDDDGTTRNLPRSISKVCTLSSPSPTKSTPRRFSPWLNGIHPDQIAYDSIRDSAAGI